MTKPTTTRSFSQLHFEDIEAHRFEDLTRQLIYDFREWRQLEATGRAGSDDGYDARGIEVVSRTAVEDSPAEVVEPHAEPVQEAERLWLVQCKREKSIGPKQLERYLNEIPDEDRGKLHGVIFVAACEFSKKSRDLFRDKLVEFGIQEGHIWGKGELEDMLYQPKNDHLLFAYFGISFQIRRRTIRTHVRTRLAAKRKLQRHLTRGEQVTIIDASDDRFPHLDSDTSKHRFERGRWRTYQYEGCLPEGALFQVCRARAYIAADRSGWDYIPEGNMVRYHDDPWDPETHKVPRELLVRWTELQAEEQAIYSLGDLRPVSSSSLR